MAFTVKEPRSRRSAKAVPVYICAALTVFTFATPLFSQDELTKRITEIASGAQQYYTPDAYSYFTRKGFQLPVQKSHDEAIIPFKAAMRIAEMGSMAREAIPTLISAFPRAVHVTEVNNVRYAGEGTFEDWIQTYVTGEKTKLLLSPLFLDYASMSKCEDFVVSTYEVTRIGGETVTIATKDIVNISVTHTIFFGAYALSAISGQSFGADLEKWQQWWNAGPEPIEAMPTTVTDAVIRQPGRLRSGQLFGDIVIRGTYRMFLSTGDNLEGRIEAKDDTSLILETPDGKAFTFKPSIITRYEYLEPPRSTPTIPKNNQDSDTLPFSFDDLRARQVEGKTLEVRINSGMVFRGTLEFIDGESMKLMVGNSAIPITRDVIVNIRNVPSRVAPPAAEPPRRQSAATSAKRDTVIIKNQKTDEWGKPMPDFVYTGTITADENGQIVLAADEGGEKKIPRSQVVRVVKNSTESYETIIKRYAAPLFCPEDMFFVDLPPGKQGRPFFKVCVDRYEYPNVKETAPKVNVSYDDAKALCAKRGRRLCTSDEWQWACGGIEGYTYPYGWNPEKEKCNTDGSRAPEPSGSRYNCVSKFGGYDMVGNVFEWVVGPKNQPSFMGGPFSKCQTITEGVGGGAKPGSGFRCCKSN